MQSTYSHGEESVGVIPTCHQSSPQPFHHQHSTQQQNFTHNCLATKQVGECIHAHHSTIEFTRHLPQTQSCFRAYPNNSHVVRKEICMTQPPHCNRSNYTHNVYPTSHSSEQLNALSNHTIPHTSPILWELSLEVREWKFLARNLDLEERVIEEIDQYTIPNKMRDKSLKVFTEWVNSASRPSWRTLGEALLEAEYVMLYEKLLELVKSHAV